MDMMRIAHMHPHLLRTFLAAQEHCNLTRAAEKVCLTQSAVSRQIAQLEEELGVRLFDRLGRALHLTEAGRTLAREAPRVLGAIDRCRETVLGHRSAGSGALRLGASTTPGLYLLPPLVGRFHRRYPGVEVAYVVDNSSAIGERLLRNELDIAFVGESVPHPDLCAEKVLMDEIVCYAAPSHPLARRPRVAPGDLAAQIGVVREPGSATRMRFDAWLAAAGVRLGRTIELSCPETVKALVAGGLGMSYLSEHGLRREFSRGSLRRIRVAGLRLRRPIFLVRHAHKQLAPSVRALVGLVRSALSGRSHGAGA